MKTASIYGLQDPRCGQIRYVGITGNSLKQRLTDHLKKANASRGYSYPVCCWLRKLGTLGLKPTMVLLEQTTDPAREAFWIQAYRQTGVVLLNCSDGGAGLPNPTPETREKIAAAARGKHPSAETLAKLSQARRGRTVSPERREQMRQAGLRRKHTPETCQKIREKKLGIPLSAAHCAKLSQSQRGKKRPPRTEAHRAASRAAQKGRPISEAHRAAIIAGHLGRPLSESHCAAISAGLKGKPKSAAHREALLKTLRFKLTEAQVRALRHRYAAGGITYKQLALEYGVSYIVMYDAITGRTWAHLQ